jgi:hypothetical protein
MYGLFLQSLATRIIDLSESGALEERELAKFESEYARIYKSWSREGEVASP